MSRLSEIITTADPAIRGQSLDAFCRNASLDELLAECEALDLLRRRSDNLYQRVRALCFLYAIHRFHFPGKRGVSARGIVPFDGYEHLLERRFEEAISAFMRERRRQGMNEAISSALAEAYHRLAFQTLGDQVRRSVRTVRGNQWMFRMGHPADQPLRIRPELVRDPAFFLSRRSVEGRELGVAPVLRERTPVRMDLSHS